MSFQDEDRQYNIKMINFKNYPKLKIYPIHAVQYFLPYDYP